MGNNLRISLLPFRRMTSVADLLAAAGDIRLEIRVPISFRDLITTRFAFLTELNRRFSLIAVVQRVVIVPET
jgi:hypothetical protein